LGAASTSSTLRAARFPEFADRFRTVYEGVDVNRFRPSLRTRRVEDPFWLLFVARVSPEKGVHVLIDAFNRVAPARPNLRLAVIGGEGVMPREFAFALDSTERVRALEPLWHDGYLETCQQRVSPDLRDRVEFRSWLPHDELPNRLASADALIFPSVWDEPFGMPVVEAMAAGLPVIASRVGALPEIMTDGVNGLLVPPADPSALADAIGHLADDSSVRGVLADAAPTRTRSFAWQRITETVETSTAASPTADHAHPCTRFIAQHPHSMASGKPPMRRRS